MELSVHFTWATVAFIDIPVIFWLQKEIAEITPEDSHY